MSGISSMEVHHTLSSVASVDSARTRTMRSDDCGASKLVARSDDSGTQCPVTGSGRHQTCCVLVERGDWPGFAEPTFKVGVLSTGPVVVIDLRSAVVAIPLKAPSLKTAVSPLPERNRFMRPEDVIVVALNCLSNCAPFIFGRIDFGAYSVELVLFTTPTLRIQTRSHLSYLLNIRCGKPVQLIQRKTRTRNNEILVPKLP